MTVRLGLAGDTMLGRQVAERIADIGPGTVFSRDLVEVAAEADAVVVNLECCISTRGERWPDPRKPFFFRAPPAAVEALAGLGVRAVTLANNHALDYGPTALLDTLEHLDGAGVAVTGAGPDLDAARRPAVLDVGGARLAVVAVTDHPADFAAAVGRPGVAYADLRSGVPGWVLESAAQVDADVVVVTPHWGPNMVASPVPHVAAAADVLAGSGASLVAGHSAHVFHGVRVPGRGAPVLFDLGDLVDDYAVDLELRNDRGLFWLVDLDDDGPVRLEAVPIALDYCHTRLAVGDEAAGIADRFAARCAALGTEVRAEEGRLVVDLR